MKIATNVHRDAFGGITISNLALFDWLRDKEDTIVGIEVILERHILGAVIFRHYLPSFFSHHIINAIDIIPKYPWDRFGNQTKKWGVLIETAKDILRKESPDVVLINGTYNIPWILARAAKDLGIPIVLRYAGVLQKEVLHKNIFIRRRLLVYERWLASIANFIIFPSKICQKVVEQDILGYAVKQALVIENPVDIKRHLKLRRTANRRYTIAAIGRWTPVKNFQAFIALHNELQKHEWSHRAILVTSFYDKNFSIPETIEVKTSMAYEELLEFYQSVDLIMVMSYFETFSNVAAEAIMSGTSVLVSKNVGFSEVLIKAGLKRMVIDSFEDQGEVFERIKHIAKKKPTKKEITKVSILLNPHKIHQNIINILNKVIKSG